MSDDPEATSPPHQPRTIRTYLTRFGAWLNEKPERKAWLAAVVITGIFCAVLF